MPCTCYSMHCETKSTLLNHCYLSPAHHPSNCAIRPIIPRINKSHSAQPRFLRGPSFYDKFAPTPRSARHLPPRTLSALDAKFRLLPDQSAPIAKNYYTNAVATQTGTSTTVKIKLGRNCRYHFKLFFIKRNGYVSRDEQITPRRQWCRVKFELTPTNMNDVGRHFFFLYFALLKKHLFLLSEGYR